MRALIASLALASGISAQSTVWVVDLSSGPGFDFTQIQAAIDVAADGDAVLVRSGDYASFTIAAKSLVVSADVGAVVRIEAPGMHVLGLAATQWVVLDGLGTLVGGFDHVAGLTCQTNLGPVWVQRCDLRGHGDTFTYSSGSSGARVRNCFSVEFRDSTLAGGIGGCGPSDGDSGLPGGAGLEVESANAAAYGCTMEGGPGGVGYGFGTYGGAGGPGALVTSAFLALGGSTAQGGNTVGGYPIWTMCGGAGGPGLQLGGSGSLVVAVANTFAGGPLPSAGCSGPSGPPIAQYGPATGTLIELAGPEHVLDVPSPVREGQGGTLTLGGAPGEFVFLLAGAAPAHVLLDLALGAPLLVAQPLAIAPAGALPLSGARSIPFTVQELGTGIETAPAFLQALFVSPLGSASLSAPAAVLLVDAGV